MDKLILEIQEGTVELDEDSDRFSRVKFYESSVTQAETDDPLVSISIQGKGMRLTIEQVLELRNWLALWLEAAVTSDPVRNFMENLRNPHCTRDLLAQDFAAVLRHAPNADFARINSEILKYYKPSGLWYIKRRAHEINGSRLVER